MNYQALWEDLKAELVLTLESNDLMKASFKPVDNPKYDGEINGIKKVLSYMAMLEKSENTGEQSNEQN